MPAQNYSLFRTATGKELFAGLFESSGLSVLVALVVTLLCALSYLTYTNEARVVELAPRMAVDHRDDDIFLSATVLSLSDETSQHAAVFLVGDSSLREAVKVARLEHRLTDRLPNSQVIDLRSGGQSILESMAIIDNIPDSANGWVVLGQSLRKHKITPEVILQARRGNRRGFTSSAVDGFLQVNGYESGRKYNNYALDNVWFLLPRMFRLLYDREVVSRIVHQSTLRARLSDTDMLDQQVRYVRGLEVPFDVYKTVLTEGRSALLEIHRVLGSRKNLELLLVETPLNPFLFSGVLGEQYYQDYLEDIKTFSRINGIKYHNVAMQAGLKDEEFIDLVHLFEGGAIHRYTDALAQVILDSQGE